MHTYATCVVEGIAQLTNFAHLSHEVSGAVADEVVDEVITRGTIHTRPTGTFVNICITSIVHYATCRQ